MRVTLTLFFLLISIRAGWGQDAPPADVSARAAILMEADTGEILRQKNPDLPLPPASTTKIMTAWLLARNLSPDRANSHFPKRRADAGNRARHEGRPNVPGPRHSSRPAAQKRQ